MGELTALPRSLIWTQGGREKKKERRIGKEKGGKRKGLKRGKKRKGKDRKGKKEGKEGEKAAQTAEEGIRSPLLCLQLNNCHDA